MPYQTFQGSLDATDLRIGVLVSRFNEFITEQLAKGALQVLEKHGCKSRKHHLCESAWSLGIGYCGESTGAALRRASLLWEPWSGAIRRISSMSPAALTDGLNQVSLETGVPIAFGVLTTDDMQQAMDRAGGKSGNKGAEAAEVAIELANLIKRLEEPPITMAARHRSRKRALQVLFEWDMRGGSIDTRHLPFLRHPLFGRRREKAEARPVHGRTGSRNGSECKEIDEQIEAKSEHWRLARMAVVDRNILRLGDLRAKAERRSRSRRD